VSSPAAVNGQLQHTSPSQVGTYKLCKRRWYMSKVARIPEPERNASADAGGDVHQQADTYFSDGTAPASASLALAIQDPAFPPRDAGPAVQVEEPRDYELGITAAGVPVRGRIDIQDARDAKNRRILDMKTKSPWSFKNTQLSSQELARDIQGNVYSEYTFTKFPETESVTFSHVNLKRPNEKDQSAGYKIVTSPPMTREHVRYVYEHSFEPVVEEMKAVAQCASWEEVEPTWTSCALFPPSRCPYENLCKSARSVEDALGSLFKSESEVDR
jgi:hypothetical protein